MPVAMILEFKEISHFGPMNVTRVESGFLETIVGIDKSVADMPGTWRTSRSTKVFPEAVDSVSVPDWVVWTITPFATITFLMHGLISVRLSVDPVRWDDAPLSSMMAAALACRPKSFESALLDWSNVFANRKKVSTDVDAMFPASVDELVAAAFLRQVSTL